MPNGTGAIVEREADVTNRHWHLGCVTATVFLIGLLIQTGSPTYAQKNPEREAYFGETHVHTSWSLDSYLAFNNTLAGPEEFYKYSLGQPITHPGGFTVKITKPLDAKESPAHRADGPGRAGHLLEATGGDR